MKKIAIAAVVVVLLAAVGIAVSNSSGSTTARPKPTTEKAPEVTITAKASIVPIKQARLAFKSSGIVDAVLVKAGGKVTKGQALARLQTTDLELQVRAAKDSLAVAEAQLAQAKAGARPEDVEAALASSGIRPDGNDQTAATGADIKAAEASLEAARERLAQSEASVVADEIAANAVLESAKAKLAQLKASPKPEDLKAAELALDQARNTLWSAQIDRDGIKGNRNFPEYQGKAADARVAAAETAVQIAETNLLKVKAGPSPEDLRVAEAAVEQAQAQLDAKRAARQATLSSAQAAVSSASAGVEKKKGTSQLEIEAALARVKQAKTAVEQAEAVLAGATLRAPFDGIVGSVSIHEGETATPGTAAVVLGDVSGFQVETSDLDEASATRIQVGQPVSVIVNAFDNKMLKGKVASLAPVATITQSGDANYTATIDLDEFDDALRWGMTSKVDFGLAK
ncbi:MAG: efflux RND transporter periplasmic adaptor subunit [Dehalococcoidales bacterium]|nr:efflux RND transporter periplasmic adaptor subunit [Dehalococcoidales bacterium]